MLDYSEVLQLLKMMSIECKTEKELSTCQKLLETCSNGNRTQTTTTSASSPCLNKTQFGSFIYKLRRRLV